MMNEAADQTHHSRVVKKVRATPVNPKPSGESTSAGPLISRIL